MAVDGADIVFVVFVLVHALARICSLVVVHFHSHCRLHPHSAANQLLSAFVLITLNLVTCSHRCSLAKLLRINLGHWFLSHINDLAGNVSKSSLLYLGTAIRPQQVGKTSFVITAEIHRLLKRSFVRGTKSQGWHLMIGNRSLHTVGP